MPMSKKDSEAFAEMLREIHLAEISNPCSNLNTLNRVMEGMIKIFRRDNGRFDENRFIRAVTEGK